MFPYMIGTIASMIQSESSDVCRKLRTFISESNSGEHASSFNKITPNFNDFLRMFADGFADVFQEFEGSVTSRRCQVKSRKLRLFPVNFARFSGR